MGIDRQFHPAESFEAMKKSGENRRIYGVKERVRIVKRRRVIRRVGGLEKSRKLEIFPRESCLHAVENFRVVVGSLYRKRDARLRASPFPTDKFVRI